MRLTGLISLMTLTFTLSASQSGKDMKITVKDADGNIYTSVKIGNQIWTVENLRTTKYNDGKPIPQIKDSAEWSRLSTPAYCSYNNTTNADTIKSLGFLYNFYAVDTKKIAPSGWHIPSDAEWDTLTNYLISHGYNWDGSKVEDKTGKSLAARTFWWEFVPDTEAIMYNMSNDKLEGQVGNGLTANNSSGFTGLPGGCRDSTGYFNFINQDAVWWSTTKVDELKAYDRDIGFKSETGVTRFDDNKRNGFSLRLIKD